MRRVHKLKPLKCRGCVYQNRSTAANNLGTNPRLSATLRDACEIHAGSRYDRHDRLGNVSSALTGNDPGLLVKSDPPFSTKCTKIVQFGARQMRCQASWAAGKVNWFEEKKRVTRGGRRGPGGQPVLALRQIVFFGWVTLSQHKWVNSRERRRAENPSLASGSRIAHDKGDYHPLL